MVIDTSSTNIFMLWKQYRLRAQPCDKCFNLLAKTKGGITVTILRSGSLSLVSSVVVLTHGTYFYI